MKYYTMGIEIWVENKKDLLKVVEELADRSETLDFTVIATPGGGYKITGHRIGVIHRGK